MAPTAEGRGCGSVSRGFCGSCKMPGAARRRASGPPKAPRSAHVAEIEFYSSYAVIKRHSGRVPGPAAGTRNLVPARPAARNHVKVT